jgi:hypothetical protein
MCSVLLLSFIHHVIERIREVAIKLHVFLLHVVYNRILMECYVSRDSAVGIAIGYGLDD